MLLEYVGNLIAEIVLPRWWTELPELVKITSEAITGIGIVSLFFKRVRSKFAEAYFFCVRKKNDIIFLFNIAKYVKQLQADLPKMQITLDSIEAQLYKNGGNSLYDIFLKNFTDIRNDLRKISARIKVTEDVIEEIGIFDCDLSLRWTNVNEAIMDWVNLPENKMLGFGWKSVIHDNDLDFVLRHMKAAIDDNREDTFDFRLIRKIGYERFNMTVTPTLDENRQVISLTATITKI